VKTPGLKLSSFFRNGSFLLNVQAPFLQLVRFHIIVRYFSLHSSGEKSFVGLSAAQHLRCPRTISSLSFCSASVPTAPNSFVALRLADRQMQRRRAPQPRDRVSFSLRVRKGPCKKAPVPGQFFKSSENSKTKCKSTRCLGTLLAVRPLAYRLVRKAQVSNFPPKVIHTSERFRKILLCCRAQARA
jgi:hypothetical protein